jgi:hypothetical protein
MRWYNVDFKHMLKFTKTFNEVPAHRLANRTWRAPMDYEEVARRRLGETDNDGPNVLPAKFSRFFSELSNQQAINLPICRSRWTIMSTTSKFWKAQWRSAKLLICTATNQDASDVEQEASSAQTGKRKRRLCPAEAKATADAPTPPSATECEDRESDPGPIKHEVTLHSFLT